MKFEPPFGDGFIWIAADASIARSLRDFFLRHRAPTEGVDEGVGLLDARHFKRQLKN
jgi:hypothetical protein